jgi:hypothetical protein
MIGLCRWPEIPMFTGARNVSVLIRAQRNGGKPDGEIGVGRSGSTGFADRIVPGEQTLYR